MSCNYFSKINLLSLSGNRFPFNIRRRFKGNSSLLFLLRRRLSVEVNKKEANKALFKNLEDELDAITTRARCNARGLKKPNLMRLNTSL